MFNFFKIGEGRVGGQNRGFIKLIIILVVVLIILGYLGFDIREILNKPLVKDNLNYVWNGIVFIWDHYLRAPAVFIWDKVVIDLIWNNIQKIPKLWD